MEFQNGSDDGNNSAAGSSPLENAVTATNGNKRKRKQIDDGNNIENHHPSKRANLHNENGAQSQTVQHQSATASSSLASTSSHAASSSSSGVFHGNNHQPPPDDQAAPNHLTAAAQLSANTAAEQQVLIASESHTHPPTTSATESDHSMSQHQQSAASNSDSHDGLAKRQRKPKSPASKTRDKQRAKERAEERRRERGECLIVEPDPACASEAVPVEEHDDTPAVQRSPADESVTVKSFGQCATKPADLRLCPLPALAWAEAADVWRLMCRKDEKALLDRSAGMLDKHPGIQARMRAILLDWLMEVCEVYKLHRETYYLAVDYLDRYLSINERLPKTRLQLIGITCLFTAAKVEEIYPPKISEFAYVTDGACTEDDIVKQELMLMLGLNWTINPVTIVGWLSVYMQLNCSNRTPASFSKLISCDAVAADKKRPVSARISGESFVYPQFSALEFVLATRILDLCTMDVEMANFQYSVVAAAVLALTINRTTALRVSGLDWSVVKPCVKWMEPFYEVVKADSSNLFLPELDEQLQASFGLRHISTHINTDDSYVIQTHTTSVALFEEALKNREDKITLTIKTNKKMAASEALKNKQCTPAAQTASALDGDRALLSPGGPLTPPDSNRKSNSGITNTPGNVNGVNSVLATVSVSDSNSSANTTASNTSATSTSHSPSGSSSSSMLSGSVNDVNA